MGGRQRKKGGREGGRQRRKKTRQTRASQTSLPKAQSVTEPSREESACTSRRQRQSPVAEMDLLELTGLTKPPSTAAPEQQEAKWSVYPHKPEP